MDKKSKESKKKISITIEKELFDWLEVQCKSKRFGSKSHGVELALKELKKKIEKNEKINYG